MDRTRFIATFTGAIALTLGAATVVTAAPPLMRLASLKAHPATPGSWALSAPIRVQP